MKERIELKVRLFFDEDTMLFGLKPSAQGYRFNQGRITCRQLPKNLPEGKYEAEWNDDEEMVIADLSKRLSPDV